MNRPLSPLTIERALAQYPVGYGGLVSVHVRGHAPRLAPDLVVAVSMVCPRTVGDARQIAQRLSREGVATGEGYFGPWVASIYQRRS